MNTAQQVGKDRLIGAINIVRTLREEIKDNPDNYKEAEILYQTTSLLMELNQYFGGGFLAPDYFEEKIDTIKHIALEINRTIFH